MNKQLWAGVLLVSSIGLACQDSGECVEGETQICTCSAAAPPGVQICRADGEFGPDCECPPGTPVANDDLATTPQQTPVDINVLANDTDPTDDPLTVTEVQSVPHHMISINADQTVHFVPGDRFAGVAEFTYTIEDTNGETDSGTVRVTVPGPKRVFVTETRFRGSFGGTVQADGHCTGTAGMAGLGGTWVAWLSTVGANAIDRVAEVGPWNRLDGVVVFRDKGDLASRDALAAIDLTEHGQAANGRVWTGTQEGGTAMPSQNCEGWTAGDACMPQAGGACVDIQAQLWTSSTSCPCCNEHRLYCLEQ